LTASLGLVALAWGGLGLSRSVPSLTIEMLGFTTLLSIYRKLISGRNLPSKVPGETIWKIKK
jgi:hypothetical protein